MLTEYNGEIFNAEKRSGNSVNIWKCVPVDGFDKFTTKSGLTYYEKNVNIEEVSPFFYVDFGVCYDGIKFGVYSYDGELLCLICENEAYSRKNNFFEFERGFWLGAKPISDLSEVVMTTNFVDMPVNKIVEYLSIEEFNQKWLRYVVGVEIGAAETMAHRKTNN